MASRQVTRNIALTPHFDAFVKSKVESGRYQSASEVVRESLRLLEKREEQRQATLDAVRQQIHAGYEQIRKGQTADPDDVRGEIATLSRAARTAKKPR